jgi:membrane protease subunit (stomatin/prohibitin family)
MNTMIRFAGGISLAATAVLLACGGANSDTSMNANSGESRAGVTSAQSDQAVNELSAARCEREQACNNVGGGAKYASMDVCMNQMRGSLANELNAYNCPRGIDQSRIERCMAAIRNEECGHPLDMVTRIDKCRTGALCLK